MALFMCLGKKKILPSGKAGAEVSRTKVLDRAELLFKLLGLQVNPILSHRSSLRSWRYVVSSLSSPENWFLWFVFVRMFSLLFLKEEVKFRWTKVEFNAHSLDKSLPRQKNSTSTSQGLVHYLILIIVNISRYRCAIRLFLPNSVSCFFV